LHNKPAGCSASEAYASGTDGEEEPINYTLAEGINSKDFGLHRAISDLLIFHNIYSIFHVLPIYCVVNGFFRYDLV
jgi:hypothetical protein